MITISRLNKIIKNLRFVDLADIKGKVSPNKFLMVGNNGNVQFSDIVHGNEKHTSSFETIGNLTINNKKFVIYIDDQEQIVIEEE